MRVPVILVVEDEALLRMIATDHFEDAGFEVIQATNGREAIEVMKARQDIGAVVTDVQMPGTPDGLELAQYVREVCPTCAIVVVSGRVQPGNDEMVSGAQFVAKPYQGETVVNMVREMIGTGTSGPAS